MTRYPLRSICLFSLLLIVTGCSLFGEAKIEHADDFSVKPPAGWKAQSGGDADYAYRLPSGSLVTLVTSCNTEVNTTSLENLTRHLLFGTRKIEFVSRKPMTVDGIEGLYSVLNANFGAVPFKLHVFVKRKENCVYDYTLMNPRAISSQDESEFIEFIQSFSHAKN